MDCTPEPAGVTSQVLEPSDATPVVPNPGTPMPVGTADHEVITHVAGLMRAIAFGPVEDGCDIAPLRMSAPPEYSNPSGYASPGSAGWPALTKATSQEKTVAPVAGSIL